MRARRWGSPPPAAPPEEPPAASCGGGATGKVASGALGAAYAVAPPYPNPTPSSSQTVRRGSPCRAKPAGGLSCAASPPDPCSGSSRHQAPFREREASRVPPKVGGTAWAWALDPPQRYADERARPRVARRPRASAARRGGGWGRALQSTARQTCAASLVGSYPFVGYRFRCSPS